MQIKRFEAKTLNQALQQIKQEFGPDAVILSAARTNSGWLGLLKKSRVVVTAATDTPNQHSFTQQKTSLPRGSQPVEIKPTGAPCTDLSTTESLLINSHASVKIQEFKPVNAVGTRFSSPLALTKTQDVPDPHPIQKIRTMPIRLNLDQRRIDVFIGPTGVGKTLTIAKIAAVFARHQHTPVSLITLDHDRIGAVDQIRRYASIIGLPLYTAVTPEQLPNIIAGTRNNELVLIDTPGISPRNQQKITQLLNMLSSLDSRITHLLIPAGTEELGFKTICEGFAALSPDCLLLTKTDETDSPSALIPRIISRSFPVSYLTTGQQIPEDLQEANADTFTNLIARVMTNNTTITIVANRLSDIYHAAHCRSAAKISRDNRLEFESETQAAQLNFKPCKHCCPKPGKSALLIKNSNPHR